MFKHKFNKLITILGVSLLITGISATPVQAIGSASHASVHVSTPHVSTPHVSTPHVSTPHVSTAPHISSTPHTSTPHISTPHTSSSASSSSIHSSFSTPSASHSGISSHNSTSSHSASSSTNNFASSNTHASINIPHVESSSNAHATQHHISNSEIKQSVINSMPQNHRINNYVNRAEHTTTYSSLTNPNHQMDFAYWYAFSHFYYNRPFYNYYPWIPMWLYNSDYHEAKQFKQQTQKYNLKWIKIDDKLVFVPEKLWQKINVGDHVQLIDNTHIKINDKIYKKY